MARSWTFGQKLGAGFAVTVALAILIGAIAVYALRTVVASKDLVIAVNAQTGIDAAKLRTAAEAKTAAARGFLITAEERFLQRMNASRADFATILAHLRTLDRTEEGRRLLDQIERAEADHQAAMDRALALRRTDASIGTVAHFFDEQVVPRREALDQQLDAYVSLGERLLEETRRASSALASSAITLLIIIALIALVFTASVALLLTRTLARQIGSAVQHVQSSSAELQAAATQQATSTKEQASAMAEISTTISELLATSRQIAESARRVTDIAEQTATSARVGGQTVRTAQDSVGGIRRQVDLIVNHMLDLGKKSQQIGGILEIINELAEQTNILSINATIEAAGAGEAGKRFGVVADEIRKLADRVGGSTKEIRGLIEEIRAAVNTTVMATESGSKAVDTGAQRFTEVTAAFQQIADLVGTTTDAAREIGLSTKQQSTAVEQVNIAIANVAQTTKETEVSANQTFQTTSQLANLSKDLARLIQPDAGA